MTWHMIRVRSKDAQKQLARTSLNEYFVLKDVRAKIFLSIEFFYIFTAGR